MTASRLRLTGRQMDCLLRKACGRTNGQIAADLGLTEKVVGHVFEEIFRTLGAVSSANAVYLAFHAGLLGRHRPERHGDHAGFRRHQRAGEDPWACDICAPAERAYRARLRAARKIARKEPA